MPAIDTWTRIISYPSCSLLLPRLVPAVLFYRHTARVYVYKENGYNESADALIRVSGASMEPQYHNGDLVYVKYTQSVEDGDIVICSTADGAVIKQMLNHKLYSLNKALPYGEKSEDDHVTIVGKVLGKVSPLELPLLMMTSLCLKK